MIHANYPSLNHFSFCERRSYRLPTETHFVKERTSIICTAFHTEINWIRHVHKIKPIISFSLRPKQEIKVIKKISWHEMNFTGQKNSLLPCLILAAFGLEKGGTIWSVNKKYGKFKRSKITWLSESIHQLLNCL